MVGHDLRCPVCSSFARDVDHSLNLDNFGALQWTCELGHTVMFEIGKETVVRQKVIAEAVPVDPPKAEVAAPVSARGPYVRRKGGKA
jgi:hypothetical protein